MQKKVWWFREYCNNGIRIRTPEGPMSYYAPWLISKRSWKTHNFNSCIEKCFNELSQNRQATKCDQDRRCLKVIAFIVCQLFVNLFFPVLFYWKGNDRICIGIQPLPYQLTRLKNKQADKFWGNLRGYERKKRYPRKNWTLSNHYTHRLACSTSGGFLLFFCKYIIFRYHIRSIFTYLCHRLITYAKLVHIHISSLLLCVYVFSLMYHNMFCFFQIVFLAFAGCVFIQHYFIHSLFPVMYKQQVCYPNFHYKFK